MRRRRRTRNLNNPPRPYINEPTKVNITWSQTHEFYILTFGDNHHFAEGQIIRQLINSFPVSDRLEEKDETTGAWQWSFTERYLENVLNILKSLEELKIFEVVLTRKEDRPKTISNIPPISKMKSIFEKETESTITVDKLSFDEAKKLYRLAARKRILADPNNPALYELNEAWRELEIQVFRTKEREIKHEEAVSA